MDLVPALYPGYLPPKHLAPFIDLLERSLTEPVQAVVAAPPQHGKSRTVIAALLQRQLRRRRGHSAYVTYNADKASAESRAARQLAEANGIGVIGDRKHWGQLGVSDCRWIGVDGGLTGYPVDDLLVVDDPFKDLKEAESRARRESVWGWWTSVAQTRRHPGSSAIIMATRWNADDLSGRLIEEGWDYINLQAIDDDTGEALWPEHRPLPFLLEKKATVGAYVWASLYQGRPRPRGNVVFGEPHYYDELPKQGYAQGLGTDLAYTAKTSADYSVLIVLRAMPIKWPDEDGNLRDSHMYYVVDVVRQQVQAPEFELVIATKAKQYPGRIIWHCAGVEKGSADFIRRKVPRFRAITTTSDKFVRAQDVAAAWNDGRVLIPNPEKIAAPWLDAFIAEVCSFTGVSDPQDDQVDALGSAFAAVKVKTKGYSSPRKRLGGRAPRM